MQRLENAKLLAEYNAARQTIQVLDKTDRLNWPEAFNQSEEGLGKAWYILRASFTSETSFREAVRLLKEAGVRMWTYYGVD